MTHSPALFCRNRRHVTEDRTGDLLLQKPRTSELSHDCSLIVDRTNYLNLIYLCKNYTIFAKFYEFMLQKVLKFANYAVAVLV